MTAVEISEGSANGGFPTNYWSCSRSGWIVDLKCVGFLSGEQRGLYEFSVAAR